MSYGFHFCKIFSISFFISPPPSSSVLLLHESISFFFIPSPSFVLHLLTLAYLLFSGCCFVCSLLSQAHRGSSSLGLRWVFLRETRNPKFHE
ncbi:hypothetical protein J1N35_035652 [Gossypium stocksii]|uniref:Uncharacterized protein n=1 Tax=Gossypium stocksii TaxID=47602 RepID=A0A9D3UUE6_9ROSI|nr:hypothetical protein J1N35_035652 [Gossypium stocksii]